MRTCALKLAVTRPDRRTMIRRILVTCTVVVAFLVAAPAALACEGQELEQPFAAYGDYAYYTLVSDRTVELHDGDSFTTPPLCVTPQHPTMRFFVRGDGALRVEVLTSEGLTLTIGAVFGEEEWAPSPILPVVGNLLDDEVSFRFTPIVGAFAIDDVWVDPYKKG
jgi:hypothetical protein